MDEDETEDSDDPDDSIFVKQLSEKEQKVLEEFRRRKRHSHSPADLMPLTIEPEKSKLDKPPSIVGSHSSLPSSPLSEVSGGASSTLSSEESKIVESYQKNA
jgi:hypothetical protein